MDREKVIKGLEQFIADFKPFCGNKADWQRVYDAIALLKAQEPLKPVPAIDDVSDWLCANCYQSVVGEEELDASGFVPVKFNFCPNCGRAVKRE